MEPQISQIENYFSFEMIEKKNLGQFSKNYRTFYPKIVTKLSKIWVWDQGSRGQKGTRSRIRIRNTAGQITFVP
jgi:hypothetical protein